MLSQDHVYPQRDRLNSPEWLLGKGREVGVEWWLFRSFEKTVSRLAKFRANTLSATDK